jgi:hypothetical protein
MEAAAVDVQAIMEFKLEARVAKAAEVELWILRTGMVTQIPEAAVWQEAAKVDRVLLL